MAILVPSLVAARGAVNTIAPNRDKTSDGWIGDQAHATRPSGHNPDETGIPERTDADTIDEVRAIDVDKDLRQPGLTMQMIVDSILATPHDRDRLIYIIWNRTIWSKSRGWRPADYSGDNPHTEHGHLSGDPAYDDDDAPWTSILSLGDAMTPAQLVVALKDAGVRTAFVEFLNSTSIKAVTAARPWQYTGGGLDAPSSLSGFNEILRNSRDARKADESDAARDAIMLAAIQTLANSGGFSVAPVIEAINAKHADLVARYEHQNAETQRKLDRAIVALTEANQEVDRLQAMLEAPASVLGDPDRA